MRLLCLAGFAILALSVTNKCLGQGKTTTMVGKWRLDVPASIKATKKSGNRDAISNANKLIADTQFEFMAGGTFQWTHGTDGRVWISKGEWNVKREAKGEVTVQFKYPDAENQARVVIHDKDALHFHFAETHPVCVYRRIAK